MTGRKWPGENGREKISGSLLRNERKTNLTHMKFKNPFVLVLTIMCSTQCSWSEQADSTPWKRGVTLAVSPFDLVHPIVRLQGEVRVSKNEGMAVQVGLGEVDKQFGFAIGAQYSWYAIGDFNHGIQLGGLAMYSNSSNALTTRKSIGRGVAMGPVVGYKFVAPFGLSVAATAGPMALRFINETPVQNGTYIESGIGLGVYAVLWLGWSF